MTPDLASTHTYCVWRTSDGGDAVLLSILGSGCCCRLLHHYALLLSNHKDVGSFYIMPYVIL